MLRLHCWKDEWCRLRKYLLFKFCVVDHLPHSTVKRHRWGIIFTNITGSPAITGSFGWSQVASLVLAVGMAACPVLTSIFLKKFTDTIKHSDVSGTSELLIMQLNSLELLHNLQHCSHTLMYTSIYTPTHMPTHYTVALAVSGTSWPPWCVHFTLLSSAGKRQGKI